MKSSYRSSSKAWFGSLWQAPVRLGLVVVLGSSLAISACGGAGGGGNQAGGQASGGGYGGSEKEGVVSEEEIEDTTAEIQTPAENPEQLVGQTIVVNGEVGSVYGPNAFSIQTDGSFVQDDQVLVLVTGGESLTLKEGEMVQLTGQVRRFSPSDLESQHGAAMDEALISQLSDEYEDRPVIIAPTIDQLTSETSSAN